MYNNQFRGVTPIFGKQIFYSREGGESGNVQLSFCTVLL